MNDFLLDTHVLLWWLDRRPNLPAKLRRMIDRRSESQGIWVSEISLWEIAMLVTLKQLELALPLREWLKAAMAPPRVRCMGITTAIAAETAMLPDGFHRDPADRILVATARVLGAKLVTLDDRILDAGVVPTVPLK